MQSENFLAFRQFGLNVQAHRMYFKYKGLLEFFFVHDECSILY